MEVGLGPGHMMLDGDPAFPVPIKRGKARQFFLSHVCCGQSAEWIKMPPGTEVGLGPSNVNVVEQAAPHGKGHSSPHSFRPMSVVVKRSPISVSAELLFDLRPRFQITRIQSRTIVEYLQSFTGLQFEESVPKFTTLNDIPCDAYG